MPVIVPRTVRLKEIIFDALADKLYVCRTYFKISEAIPYIFNFTKIPKNENEMLTREMDLDEAVSEIGDVGTEILKKVMFLGGIERIIISAYSLEILVEEDTSWDYLYPEFENAVREAEQSLNQE